MIQNYDFAWKHSPILDDEKFCYLYLLAKTGDLTCFHPNPEEMETQEKRIKAHQKAAALGKININEICFFDLIPHTQLAGWFSSRNIALKNVAEKLQKGPDYEILHKAHVLTTNISHQNLTFSNKEGRVLYNIFGSATGRLTTTKQSVPVLNLKKEQRHLIKPKNDAFVELDFNAAEVRMLMALSGKEQPEGDIHNHLKQEIFGGWGKRSDFKERLFAWLYNPSSDDTVFDDFFSRETFRDFFAVDEQVLTTPFGRQLSVDERKAQNYLLQSSTSDQVLENGYKIQKMLKGTKTTIAFTLHDSIILDMAQEDAIMLRDLKKEFEKTRWGNFTSTCKIGRHFGNLKELKI